MMLRRKKFYQVRSRYGKGCNITTKVGVYIVKLFACKSD